MPTTKHELLDWLMDVPEDAEIGTDGEGLALLAILGTNVHLLEIGHIPNADELYAEAINQAMMERLRRIDAAGGETDTGVIIVTFQGYISGIPSLFSDDFLFGESRFAFQSRTETMNDEKWIVSDRDHLGGKPRVQGTRISVAFLLECLASGMSVAEIVDAYPTLSEDAVQGALRELAHEKEAAVG